MSLNRGNDLNKVTVQGVRAVLKVTVFRVMVPSLTLFLIQARVFTKFIVNRI